MSLVDDVFGSIPGPLIDQWGIDGVYVKKVENAPYDPTTGTFAVPETAATEVAIRLVPLRIKPEEVNGEIQITDLKILISGDALGDYYPKVSDWIKYSQAGVQRTAKVIMPLTHRGSAPVLHSIIARLA
ncbi:MAG: hypothetical protein ACO3S8_04205 [Aquiluna sp.]